MENSGGDELRIWLRENADLLNWDQALELLDETLDETYSEKGGADIIDAWMDFAVPRFAPQQLLGGYHIARQYGLGDVYVVALDDTDTAMKKVMADLCAKAELVKREEEAQRKKVGDGDKVREKSRVGNADEQEDSGIDSGAEETREKDQLLQ